MLNAVDVAARIEDSGAAMIAVHGRTRVQLYSGEADWDVVRRVRERVRIPVIGSGDVIEPAQALAAAGERRRRRRDDRARGAQQSVDLRRNGRARRRAKASASHSGAELVAALAVFRDGMRETRADHSFIGRYRGLACHLIKGMRDSAVVARRRSARPRRSRTSTRCSPISSKHEENRRMARESYQVFVSKDYFKFNAAHFMAYPGFRERLHGHNYRVAVRVEGRLGADGYVVDFGDIKKATRKVCDEMDERLLVPMKSDCLKIERSDGQVAHHDRRRRALQRARGRLRIACPSHTRRPKSSRPTCADACSASSTVLEDPWRHGGGGDGGREPASRSPLPSRPLMRRVLSAVDDARRGVGRVVHAGAVAGRRQRRRASLRRALRRVPPGLPPGVLKAKMWEAMVTRMEGEMSRRGLVLAPADRDTILAYLKRNAGES